MSQRRGSHDTCACWASLMTSSHLSMPAEAFVLAKYCLYCGEDLKLAFGVSKGCPSGCLLVHMEAIGVVQCVYCEDEDGPFGASPDGLACEDCIDAAKLIVRNLDNG